MQSQAFAALTQEHEVPIFTIRDGQTHVLWCMDKNDVQIQQIGGVSYRVCHFASLSSAVRSTEESGLYVFVDSAWATTATTGHDGGEEIGET